MDEATRSVGLQLDRAAADLSAVQHQLEAHFNEQYKDVPEQQHPDVLLQRLQRLSAALPALAADCESISAAKRGLQTTTAAKMAENAESIRALQVLAGR
eukprot:SAG22_NODE_137_length_18056_cov_9.974940_8_plen_99_part_00